MSRPVAVHVNEAILLLVGAAFLTVMVDEDRLYWTPLVLGLTMIAAGTVAGRANGYWASGCVLVGWGAAVVFVRLVFEEEETSLSGKLQDDLARMRAILERATGDSVGRSDRPAESVLCGGQ